MVAVKCGAHNAAGVARTFAAGVQPPQRTCPLSSRRMRTGEEERVSTAVKRASGWA